ncbi:MAG: alpha/beta fold hydrolase [Rhizobiaceae bacterium]|nr:alpha/beta fold hydrolase [Rhizobiaceae bacterium]MCV0407050.1 alpha/beta fold hydrolase [Rhizobiaceae bacterium]
MSSLSTGFIRSVFALADHIAPVTAGRLAFRLFCRTPSPRAMSAKEREAVAAAGPLMATARVHRLRMRRGHATAWLFRPATRYPSGRTVLVLHGWRSRTEHMRPVIEALLDEGFRVVAIDLPGHGRSSGRQLNLALAVEAAQLADQWFGPFAAIVGHSFGGAVAVNAVAGSIAGVPAIAADRLALIGAPSSMPAIFEDFGRFLNLGPRAQTALADEVRRVAGQPLSAYVGAEQLAALDSPTLVVHAPDGKEVPFSEAHAFEKAGSHVTLMRAAGLGHRRIMADPHVAKAVARFVATPLDTAGAADLAA